MTYDAFETSLESGRPIELYRVDVGSTLYRWTSAEDDISSGGTDYEAIEISRTEFAQGPDDRDNTIEITVPASNPLAATFVGIVPPETGTVTILRFHRGDSQLVTIWKGTVQTVTFTNQGRTAMLACRPEVGASSRPIPRFTFQGLCNHALYDNRCQIAEGSFRHTNTVTAVSADGRTITVNGLAAMGAEWATAGYVTFGTDRRLVLSSSGSAVTLLLPFRSSPLGMTVSVQAGCDHTAPTCKAKFNNIVNFGGFPYVPKINIFESGLEGAG